MKLQPRIVYSESKRLIGVQLEMSLTDNKTGALWQGFMPRKNEIQSSISNDLFSLQVYKEDYFDNFNPSTQFVKWALKEVENDFEIPDGMELFILPKGMYAVFVYKGLSTDPTIFKTIFQEWLPASTYVLDHRPHFEVLGAKYKNNDPNSEEEIWIPVRTKSAVI